MDEALKRANEETKAWKSRQVDRFNPSTRATYQTSNVNWYNAQTLYYKTGYWNSYFTNR